MRLRVLTETICRRLDPPIIDHFTRADLIDKLVGRYLHVSISVNVCLQRGLMITLTDAGRASCRPGETKGGAATYHGARPGRALGPNRSYTTHMSPSLVVGSLNWPRTPQGHPRGSNPSLSASPWPSHRDWSAAEIDGVEARFIGQADQTCSSSAETLAVPREGL